MAQDSMEPPAPALTMGLTELGTPVGSCPNLASACPQGGAQYPGLGLPQGPPAAWLRAGMVGQALAARSCPATMGSPWPVLLPDKMVLWPQEGQRLYTPRPAKKDTLLTVFVQSVLTRDM